MAKPKVSVSAEQAELVRAALLRLKERSENQQAVADLVGMSQQTISRLLSPQNPISLNAALSVAAACPELDQSALVASTRRLNAESGALSITSSKARFSVSGAPPQPLDELREQALAILTDDHRVPYRTAAPLVRSISWDYGARGPSVDAYVRLALALLEGADSELEPEPQSSRNPRPDSGGGRRRKPTSIPPAVADTVRNRGQKGLQSTKPPRAR